MKFKFELGDLIKIPNILCYLRILMVPLFLHIYFTAERPQDFYLATLVVMLSGLTDFFDGQIARRCNMITDLGRIIDPLADKLMQLAMLVALTVRVKYMYLLVIFLVLKEVISAVTGFFVMKFAKKRLNVILTASKNQNDAYNDTEHRYDLKHVSYPHFVLPA